MTDEPLCDKPDCLEPAEFMLALRFANNIGAGYWCCSQHEGDCFWQVVKIGLHQDDQFDVIVLNPQQVEDLRISRP